MVKNYKNYTQSDYSTVYRQVKLGLELGHGL